MGEPESPTITIPTFVDQEVSHLRRAQVSAEEESPVHTKLAW